MDQKDCGRLIAHGITKSWTRLSDFHFQLTLVITSQYIHISNHHVANLKLIQRYIAIYLNKTGISWFPQGYFMTPPHEPIDAFQSGRELE